MTDRTLVTYNPTDFSWGRFKLDMGDYCAALFLELETIVQVSFFVLAF